MPDRKSYLALNKNTILIFCDSVGTAVNVNNWPQHAGKC